MILTPIISERSLEDAGGGVFTFRVSKEAKKDQIRALIEEVFNVHVQGVTTAKIKGKKKVSGKKRMKTEEKDTKKARVRLAKGEKIDLFEVTK